MYYCSKKDRKPRQKKTATHLQKHAQKRALTRYRIDLTFDDIGQLNKQITDGKAFRLEPYSNNRSLWQIILPNSKPAFVVYDKKRGSIVTFLEEQMVMK